MTGDADAKVVADRLGLGPDDVPDCQQALDEVEMMGFDAYVDQTLSEAGAALKAAYAGQKPDEATARRVRVRRVIAENMATFIAQREALAGLAGPRH